jgi:hypothetical protein
MPRILNEKKGVYHGDLVRLTAAEPLAVIFTGPVLNSKNSTGPASHGMIYFREIDATMERYYNIENAAIRAYLSGVAQNTVAFLRATGTRDAATVEIQYGGAPAVPAPLAVQPPPPPPPAGMAPPVPPAMAPPPPPAAPAGVSHPPAHTVVDHRPPTILGQYGQCFLAAMEVVHRSVEKMPELKGASPDAMLAAAKEISATLFIEWNKSAGMRPLRGSNGEH